MARVVVVFYDKTLGGTGRSALTFGTAWARAGKEVIFFNPLGIHMARASRFESVGSLVTDMTALSFVDGDLVHLHHGIDSPLTRKRYSDLRHMAVKSGATITLITNNIFAESDSWLKGWPGPVRRGVLAEWASWQYRFTVGLRRRPEVIANPQDLDFFRPPSDAERRSARDRFELAHGAFVILRVGSPHAGKWSGDYVALARRLRPGAVLVLIGIPDDLKRKLQHFPRVTFLTSTADDLELRDLYWASDVFALSARQGESFGNVVLEALGCGLRVTYRSRPFRDNSPALYPHVRLSISRGLSNWLTASSIEVESSSDQASDLWLSSFSLDESARRLRNISSSKGSASVAGGPHWWKFLPVGLRHNPVISRARFVSRVLRSLK